MIWPAIESQPFRQRKKKPGNSEPQGGRGLKLLPGAIGTLKSELTDVVPAVFEWKVGGSPKRVKIDYPHIIRSIRESIMF